MLRPTGFADQYGLTLKQSVASFILYPGERDESPICTVTMSLGRVLMDSQSCNSSQIFCQTYVHLL